MQFWLGLLFILFLTGCFKKTPSVQPSSKPAPAVTQQLRENVSQVEKPLLSKEIREAIYFSASLEREALKILTKSQQLSDNTLFSVLSYAIEIAAGVKKPSPSQMDCSRFRFAKNPADLQEIEVYKICQKPESRVALIKSENNGRLIHVRFFLKEWVSIVGLPVTLTGEDTQCLLKSEAKKLQELQCFHWRKTLETSVTSTEELRLQIFHFNRKDKNQFLLKGGIFKDLVERRKIEVLVPLEGRIKRFEKELKVIDQFESELNSPEAVPASTISPAAPPSVQQSVPLVAPQNWDTDLGEPQPESPQPPASTRSGRGQGRGQNSGLGRGQPGLPIIPDGSQSNYDYGGYPNESEESRKENQKGNREESGQENREEGQNEQTFPVEGR